LIYFVTYHFNGVGTNGAIYSVNGPHAGRIFAVDCCMDAAHCGSQPHSEPLVAASPDDSEFKTYKNVVFESVPIVGGAPAQIKLTKSGKCLTSNNTVVSLDAWNTGSPAAEWMAEKGAVAGSIVLVSKGSGACVV
jgi:hypothetical protein